MNYIKNKLSRQLLLVIAFSLTTILVSLGFVLPNTLLPVYEKNLYNYLKQPLTLVSEDIKANPISEEIGYIYIYDEIVSTSDNIEDIINTDDILKITKKITKSHGKFIFKKKIYYYYTDTETGVKRVALTNDSYIKQAQRDALQNIFPIVFLTLFVVSLLLIVWASVIVRRIERLRKKIDHIDDKHYNHSIGDTMDDEIHSLELAIEDMRISLKNQEDYRNQMYQNISHDFKTPLTVIKSYIEAVEDHVEDNDKAIKVIKEQAEKLEEKVHSLLYLNKLDYIKEMKLINREEINIEKLLNDSIEKLKYKNKDLKFIVNKTSNGKFYGTNDSWETVIDNILNNFIRYAIKEIKITIKKNQIIFYNDGPNIDKNLLSGIFVPFRKGIKGEFGLGLSIVKKSLEYMGYDVSIKNHKKIGVSIVITKD